MTEVPDLTDLFSNPVTIAAFAALMAYLIPLGLRQWINVPPAPVALVVAALIWIGGQVLGPEQQSLVISLLAVLLTTASAIGISTLVNNRALKRNAAVTAASNGEIKPPWWYHF